MEARGKKHRRGIVYSTDPDFVYDYGTRPLAKTLPPCEQRLRILIDAKGRSGKIATVIKGFVGSDDDREALSRDIKTRCGTGGTVKAGDIIIQGDMRERIKDVLTDLGYRV